MRRTLCVLGAAASFGELAFVYFEASDLRLWGIHRRAVKNIESAFGLTQQWIKRCNPMLVIVPDYGDESRKGARARAMIEMVVSAAAEEGLACIRAVRPQIAYSKYHEAALLAVVYPQLASRVPQPRRKWDAERHGVILFEALAVLHQWLWQNNEGPEALPIQ